jgi:hypothetical protein
MFLIRSGVASRYHLDRLSVEDIDAEIEAAAKGAA